MKSFKKYAEGLKNGSTTNPWCTSKVKSL
jgi:hypothetical protein